LDEDEADFGEKMVPVIIDTEEKCDLLFEAIKNEPIVSMDTEFVWSRSYYPLIGVIQIGVSPEKSYLFDAAKMNECPQSFKTFLENENIMKVCHDAYQDIQIINYYAKTTSKNIFDTQLAAAFMGYGRAISLSEMVEKICGKNLTKTQTLTNWLKRPLTDAQMEYALDDVRYLSECANFLIKRTKEKYVFEWILEDCQELSQISEPFSLTSAVARSYSRELQSVQFKNRKKLYRLCFAVENMARSKNLPRSFLFKPGQLAQIINCNPENQENLKKTSLSPKVIARYSEFILSSIRDENIPIDDELIEKSRYYQNKNAVQIGDMTKEIAVTLDKIAQDNEICSSTVYNRKQLTELVRQTLENKSPAVLHGWRNVFFGGVWNDFWAEKLK